MITTMLWHQFDEPPTDERVLQAWCDWLTAHGIDPEDVPTLSVIERDIDKRRVVFDAFVRDCDGNFIIEDGYAVREVRYVQLEAVPLPFPPNE